jgi:molybdate-binding protein
LYATVYSVETFTRSHGWSQDELAGKTGISRTEVSAIETERSPEQTLVMVSCDPAAGLLATELARAGHWRLLVLPRSSTQALDLLGAGLVYLAGVHLSKASRKNDNAGAVREKLGAGFSLLQLTRWTEGIAIGPGQRAESIQRLMRSKMRWVGREPGSGARQCLDELLEGRAPPKRLARDHRRGAEAIRSGWADVGVCLQLVSEEAGLEFLSVREETYDVCYRTDFESDPRMRAFLDVVRSRAYRQMLSELPGDNFVVWTSVHTKCGDVSAEADTAAGFRSLLSSNLSTPGPTSRGR